MDQDQRAPLHPIETCEIGHNKAYLHPCQAVLLGPITRDAPSLDSGAVKDTVSHPEEQLSQAKLVAQQQGCPVSSRRPIRARHRDVFDNQGIAADRKQWLGKAPGAGCEHTSEVVRNVGEEVNVVRQPRPVALVPEIRLIHAISNLTHVDRGEP
jgi:hypothetical protein